MKRIFNLLAMAAIMAFAACSEDKTDDGGLNGGVQPEFPAVERLSITAGDSASFAFSPNMDWTVSVSDASESELRWFKVEVNGREIIGKSESGRADGEVSVTVTGTMEDFESSHTLVLNLTMGQKTQTLAEVSMLPAGSTFEAYAAAVSNGQLVYEEGKVTYSSSPLENGAMLSLYGDDNINWLRVTANRDWKAAAPKWLSLSAAGGEKGKTTEVELQSPAAERPFADEEGKIRFYIDENSTLAEYGISVRGCADELDYSIINANNVVLSSSGGVTEGTVTAAYGSKVFFASADGDEWIKFADGKGFTESVWGAPEKEAGLHQRKFMAEYGANPSDESNRRAYLFGVPRGKAESVDESRALDESGNVSAEFEEYLIASYTQPYKVEGRPEGVLYVQSMIGKGNFSTGGEDLFALFQEFEKGSYPEGWWGDALNDMPAVYKVTLGDLKDCERAVMSIENGDDWTIVLHPDDVAAENEWIERIQEYDSDGYHLYNFMFKYEADPKYDENGNVTDWGDLTWVTPKVPEAYVVFTQGAGANKKVTGALLLEIDKEAMNSPLQNASTSNGLDTGFSLLSPGVFGYDERYGDIPQYKIDGWNDATAMPDVMGRLSAGALILRFHEKLNMGFDNFEFEAVEGGLLADKLGWPDGNSANEQYVFAGEPFIPSTNAYIYYYFDGSGPDQFRILCYDSSKKMVCTIYIYYQKL